jgi:flagellar biosynthesis/type III secretory pathway M-ring protein FliF/YscJ
MDREALGLQRSMSDELTARVQADLEALWPRKTLVRVQVALDHSRSTTQESILPTNKFLLTENRKERPQAQAASGSPSVADQTQGPTPAAVTRPPTVKETELQRTFQGPIGERRTTQLVPRIQRITVSLAVDKALEGEAKAIEDFVGGAVGLDPLPPRSDALTTTVTNFAIEPQPASPLEIWLPLVRQYGPPAAQVVSLLLVLWFLRWMLVRGRRPIAAPAETIARQPSTPEHEARQLRRQLEDSIGEDPGALSRLVESWLTERK